MLGTRLSLRGDDFIRMSNDTAVDYVVYRLLLYCSYSVVVLVHPLDVQFGGRTVYCRDSTRSGSQLWS